MANKMMNHLKCVIFDLDGTLVNTIEDLGRACDYLLERKSLPLKWSTEDYKNFVGDGAKLLVDRAFEGRLSQAELSKQYELFKKKYNEIKLDNAYVYDGIYELVDYLKKAGLFLAVCTNKPNASAKSMVNALFGEKTFDYVLGAVDGLAKKPDRAMPSAILNALKIKPYECVWIGDSAVDTESAKNLGCSCIAVSWGFRPRKSLEEKCPDFIADKPEDILNFLN